MMTKKEIKNQRKLEARLQSEKNARKSAAIQTKTGIADLNSSFFKIQRSLIEKKDRYGYVVQLNRAA